MKRFKITKGSEGDFLFAPEWALMLVNTKYQAPRFYEGFNIGDRYVSVGETSNTRLTPPGLPPVSESEIIARREPINEPVWDGEGLPPVGVECEWLASGDHGWVAVTVLVYDGVDACLKPSDGTQSFVVGNVTGFRPLRSEEEKERIRNVNKLVSIIAGADTSSNQGDFFDYAEAIYDAGWRKHDDI